MTKKLNWFLEPDGKYRDAPRIQVCELATILILIEYQLIVVSEGVSVPRRSAEKGKSGAGVAILAFSTFSFLRRFFLFCLFFLSFNIGFFFATFQLIRLPTSFFISAIHSCDRGKSVEKKSKKNKNKRRTQTQ